jgi:desulfoferrodoxin-like iron-binding protein
MLQTGKRYQCASCGTEALVTKASQGTLLCCGSEMPQQQPKQTKSAD